MATNDASHSRAISSIPLDDVAAGAGAWHRDISVGRLFGPSRFSTAHVRPTRARIGTPETCVPLARALAIAVSKQVTGVVQ